ncbi:hypothetical protein pb186bvf_002091 [Paramecium bursaria]
MSQKQYYVFILYLTYKCFTKFGSKMLGIILQKQQNEYIYILFGQNQIRYLKILNAFKYYLLSKRDTPLNYLIELPFYN